MIELIVSKLPTHMNVTCIELMPKRKRVCVYHLRLTLNCAPNFVGHELLSMDSLTDNYFQRYI
jgi:hypothetical protein